MEKDRKMKISKLFHIMLSFIIPMIFNKMVSFSEIIYFTYREADIFSVISIIGVIGIVTVQTYGTYKLIEQEKELK